MAKKNYDDDDGRTIVDMSDLERPPLLVPRFDRFRKKNETDEKPSECAQSPSSEANLSGGERRAAIGGALSASLLIGGVFAAVIGIFIFILTRLLS